MRVVCQRLMLFFPQADKEVTERHFEFNNAQCTRLDNVFVETFSLAHRFAVCLFFWIFLVFFSLSLPLFLSPLHKSMHELTESMDIAFKEKFNNSHNSAGIYSVRTFLYTYICVYMSNDPRATLRATRPVRG